MESARPAGADDLAAIVALINACATELRPTRGGDVWFRREGPTPPPEDYLARRLASPDDHVIVGLIDAEVIGFATVALETLRDGTRLGVIDDLYVDVEARAIGVGEAMAVEAVAWCESHGCFGIDASALPGNRAAKNFFETHGFIARRIVMHRRLG